MKEFFAVLLILLVVSSCKDPDNPEPMESLPVVSLAPLSVTEGNEGEKSIFASVSLSKSSSSTVTIFVSTEDGSAEAGSDYVAVSKSVDFAPGVVQENIRLDILGDVESELDEEFTLNIVDVSGATLGTSSVSVLIENDDLGSGNVIIPSNGYSTPTEYDGMSLLWSDEFEGSELDETYWTYEIGNGDWGWGNNELEFYRKENTSIVDGHLVIEALEEFYSGFNYTSSRLITKGKFDFKYGRVDIRAVLPEGQGVWPALWMLGANFSEVGWPACGELDIMELLGHQPSTVHATAHFNLSNGNPDFDGNHTNLSGGKKFSDEFHVFSMRWEENLVEFYLDDNLYHTVTPSSIGIQNDYPFNEKFFFIFNVAVGGNWPGSPDETTSFPQHMIVDYIRVFQ